MACWDGEVEGSEGLLMTEIDSSGGEARGCWPSKVRCILMPSYSGPTRGLRPAQKGISGLIGIKT